MNKIKFFLILIITIFIFWMIFKVYFGKAQQAVVIYASIDQMYAEVILSDFEKQTGIKVKAVYDVEADKTTGMVNRLIAERNRPQADVFWNGEIIQTIHLKEKGVLMPFDSKNAKTFPESFRDPDGYWVAFGGRARVIIVNKTLLPQDEYPSSIFDFLDHKWDPSEIGLAYPMFGTTATHFTVLYDVLGQQAAMDYFAALKKRGVKVLTGNATVRDQVVNGSLLFGLTDTDDVCAALLRNEAIDIVFPDLEDGAIGTTIIPNTVAMINGARNQSEAKQLIEYLLSFEVEKALMNMGWIHIPVHPIPMSEGCFDVEKPNLMQIDFVNAYKNYETVKRELSAIFIR